MEQLGGENGAEGRRSQRWRCGLWNSEGRRMGRTWWCSWGKEAGLVEKFPPAVMQCLPGALPLCGVRQRQFWWSCFSSCFNPLLVFSRCFHLVMPSSGMGGN